MTRPVFSGPKVARLGGARTPERGIPTPNYSATRELALPAIEQARLRHAVLKAWNPGRMIKNFCGGSCGERVPCSVCQGAAASLNRSR